MVVVRELKCRAFLQLVIWMLLVGWGKNAEAQGASSSSFKLRYKVEQKGDIYYVSNSIIDCGTCKGKDEAPPGGVANNNEYLGVFIDIDRSDDTFNSSSSDLNLPDCSTITFAALYWKASLSPANARYSERTQVKLRLPSSSTYLDLTADEDINGQFFKDVTNILKASNKINGSYTVANIVADEGEKNLYGGWTLVIVTKQELMPLRSLAIFDGLAYVKANSKESFNINGFFTPPSGPVNLDFGFVAYDGDRGISGDNLRFNNVKVYDNLHSPLNTFNSSITYKGAIVKSRFPSNYNTLGYDASIIHLDNENFQYLKNGQDSVVISLKTEGEEYFVGVLTSAIDIYSPSYRFSHSYKSSTSAVKMQEVIELEYNIKNIGNDIGKDVLFCDTIPEEFEYERSSLEFCKGRNEWQRISDDITEDGVGYIYKVPKVVVKLPTIAPDSVAKIRYRVRLKSDADVIRCANGLVSKNGWVEYFDEGTSLVKKISSGSFSEDYCQIGGSLNIPVEVPPLPNESVVNTYCSDTPVFDLHLPTGYSLYSADDPTFQYPLVKLGQPGVYKAYRKLSTGCEYSFNVIARADSVTIYSQPDNIEATVGSGVAFSVGVRGENVSFQWQVNKGTGTWEDIAGATERSLTIPKVTEEMDGYNYRLRVTTPCKDYLLSVKVVLSVKKQPVSKPSEEPEPQPEVKDQNVGALFVPNAFMPASNTQELRSFVVKGHGLAKWQMTIFNKWDQVIWKTDLIGTDGSPAEGWDGKMFGADAPQGAYMWAIEAVFEDGKEWEGMSVRDSKPRKSGVVYLLR